MYLQLGLHYVSLLDVNFDKEEKDAVNCSGLESLFPNISVSERWLESDWFNFGVELSG